MIELDFIRSLIEAIDQSGIDSVEITRAGTRIRISKSPMQVAGSGPAPTSAVPGAPAPAAHPAGTNSGAVEPAAQPPQRASNLTEIRSPMVGTFYRAPAPEAPPYVEIGHRISKGQTLCILEAMKLMNELESEVDGILREVLVENAEPVEYGQTLFLIEPAGS